LIPFIVFNRLLIMSVIRIVNEEELTTKCVHEIFLNFLLF
jgi:hypothetical protein